MGQQMGLDLQQGVAGVNGVAPVGAGDMKAEDVDGRPFAFEPPPDYTDKSGVAWLVQWLDNQTVVVVSPLRQSTDLIACHLETKTCDVAASAPAGIVVPELREEPVLRLTPRRAQRWNHGTRSRGSSTGSTVARRATQERDP